MESLESIKTDNIAAHSEDQIYLFSELAYETLQEIKKEPGFDESRLKDLDVYRSFVIRLMIKIVESCPDEYMRFNLLTGLTDKMLELPRLVNEFGLDETTAIETLKSVIPEKYCMPINKLSNEITKNFVGNGKIALNVSGNRRKPVTTYCSLNYGSYGMPITRQEITPYDRCVHNAVCSLYEAGNRIITPHMVYRTMTGMSETENPSPQAVEAVRESLDKIRFIRLKMDYAAEAKARGIQVKKAEYDTYLLNADKMVIEAGGTLVEAYRINAKPALYEYAQITKQVISVPLALLDTRKAESIRNTDEVITMKEYLIRRIEAMKRNKGMSNKIVYETVFNEAGITDLTPKKSFTLRQNVKAMLDLWRDKKYIKDYSEYKDGRTIKGVSITY